MTDSQASTPDTDASSAEPQASTSAGGLSRGRRWTVRGVIALAAVLSLFTILAVWVNRLVFNPDNWSQTSTQLLQNPDIRSSTANFVVDRIYANVDVAGQLATALPPRLKPLAGPLAGALRGGAVRAVDAALQRPRIQSLWAAANRRASQLLVNIVNGGKGAVSVANGVVTLDLTQLIDTVAARLGLPSSITSKLPSNIGTLTVFKSNKLSLIEDLGNAIRHLALLFSILVPALWILAIGLARGRRRRTLISVGFSMVIVGIIGVAVRRILQTAIVNTIVSNEAQRPAARAVLAIGTKIFAEISIAFVFVGVVVIVAGWFAGPARPAVAARRAIAPFLREHPDWTFAIVGSVMLLLIIWQPIHALGTPVGIIVFLCLAGIGTELLRRQTELEFPGARPGEASTAMRERFAAYRARSRRTSAAGSSLPEQIEHLEALRDRGVITAAEFGEAKAQLLKA